MRLDDLKCIKSNSSIIDERCERGFPGHFPDLRNWPQYFELSQEFALAVYEEGLHYLLFPFKKLSCGKTGLFLGLNILQYGVRTYITGETA